jgi:hypothetical protein
MSASSISKGEPGRVISACACAIDMAGQGFCADWGFDIASAILQ